MRKTEYKALDVTANRCYVGLINRGKRKLDDWGQPITGEVGASSPTWATLTGGRPMKAQAQISGTWNSQNFRNIGRIAFLGAVLVGGSLPRIATAFNETHNAELRANFESVCDNSSASYDVAVCRDWVSSQSPEDQAYLESYYVTDSIPEEPSSRQDVIYLARELEPDHFEGAARVERKTVFVPHWTYTVVMEWCQNKAGTKINGCKSSYSTKRTFIGWDYFPDDETRVRTNATNNSWTRVYYQGHFKSVGIFGQLSVQCWPEIKMTARAQTTNRVTYSVNQAARNCNE